MARPLARGDTVEPVVAGRHLIDTDDGPKTDEKIAAGVAQGYERLIELCGGNEEQARTLTFFANQLLTAGFFLPGLDEDSPFRLSDGTPGLPISNDEHATGRQVQCEITFSIAENGRPRLDVDYRLNGPVLFAAVDGKNRFLGPDSHLQGHFRGELRENDRLALLGAPSYSYYFQAADGG